MSRRSLKIQNIMEANVRLEKKFLNEQTQSTFPPCVAKMGPATSGYIRGKGKWVMNNFTANGNVTIQGDGEVYKYKCDGDEILVNGKKMIDDVSGWNEIVNYYYHNKSKNWTFEKGYTYVDDKVTDYLYKGITLKSKDSDKDMIIYSDGDVYLFKSDTNDKLDNGTWSMDGTTPKFNMEIGKYPIEGGETQSTDVSTEPTTDVTTDTSGEITRKASGIVTNNDTDANEAFVTDNKIMVRGSKGMLVQEVQHKLLNIEGYDQKFKLTKDVEGCKSEVSRCDGIYGTITKQAVRQYQKDNGLAKDGVVGKQTAKSMGLI